MCAFFIYNIYKNRYSHHMKKKHFILLFIISLAFISLFYLFNGYKNSKDNLFTHLFLVQYIPFKTQTTHFDFSLPFQKSNSQKVKKIFLEDATTNIPEKKSFFSISHCGTFVRKPDSLSKKFNKNQTNQQIENKSSLFEKFDCGLIQTIIPLSF